MDRPEDMVEHIMVELCPAWPKHRCVLIEAIGDGNLARPAPVETMEQGGPKVCEAVMLAKEVAGHEWINNTIHTIRK